MKRCMRFVFLAAAATLCGVAHCGFLADPGRAADNGGGGIETIALEGVVVDSKGIPESGAFIRLYPAAYNPLSNDTLGTFPSDTTDSDGRYQVSISDSGTYTMIGLQPVNGTRMLHSGISKKTAQVETDILRPPGAVTVALPESPRKSGEYLYIPGTPFRRSIGDLPDTCRFVVFDSVPAAAALSIALADTSGSEPSRILCNSVMIFANDTGTATSLPSPWNGMSLGEVGVIGGAAARGGHFNVSGGGPDIWDSADGFYFVYQQLSGDFEIKAYVRSLAKISINSKAGVMMRENLDPRARHVTMSISMRVPGAVLHFRNDFGDTSRCITQYEDSIAAPCWVKLIRRGDVFEGYASPDNTTWYLAGSDTVGLSADLYAGLSVTSNNENKLCTAVFDSVSILW